MKKKRLILSLALSLSLLAYSGFSFADGPELDDHTTVNSGPGVALGKNENTVSVADSYLQVYSGVLSGENVPLLSDYGFSGHGVYGYNEMSADLFKLKDAYPALQLSSLGKTIDGRELYCGIVGNPNASKKILVHASIHAREYI
ncbi:MAG: peptidase, partial [Oribacterium parvum]|nr:peptidase [Oribacterium parvum]